MKFKTALSITLILFLFCYPASNYANEIAINDLPTRITTNIVKFYDKDRKRLIPVKTYVVSNRSSQENANAHIIKLPVAIINHGYTVRNTEYSFLANALAANGYFVVSIQHDLKSDLPLVQTGNLFE